MLEVNIEPSTSFVFVTVIMAVKKNQIELSAPK